MLTMFSLFLDIDFKIMSPISGFQIYKSRTNVSVSSATTITLCLKQEMSSAAATICVSVSPSLSMTVWPSPLECVAKSLIRCLLLELLKNSLTKTSARGGCYASRLAYSWSLVVFNLYPSNTVWKILHFEDTYLRYSFITSWNVDPV